MKEGLDAFIPAGDLGTRLRPLTLFYPKPTLWVKGKPLICYALESCWQKCRLVFVSTYYKEEKVQRLLINPMFTNTLTILSDHGLINIGGSLIKHKEIIFNSSSSKHLIIIPADHVLRQFPVDTIYQFHLKNNSDLTLILAAHKPYGDYVIVNKNQIVTRIVNKDESSENLPSYTGICLFKKSFLKKIISESKMQKTGFDLTRSIIIPAINRRLAYGYLLPANSYWDDVGTWFRYIKHNFI